jgi:hypothetical protein
MNCSFEGCGRRKVAKGLCSAHHAQMMRGATLSDLRNHRGVRNLRPLSAHPSDPAIAFVPLTRGMVALISAVDADAVGKYNWVAEKAWSGFYASTNLPRVNGRSRGLLRLHVLIGRQMGLAPGALPDHRDGNGLDCRRDNLRAATGSQNACNSRLRSDNTSGIKGVSWRADTRRWSAQIVAQGRHHSLGLFVDEADAQAAVVAARIALHGDFANHGAG